MSETTTTTTTTSKADDSHWLARGISWLLLGLTVLAFGGAFVLQWMGCGILFDPSRSEPAVAYGFLMLPLNALSFAVLGTLINTYHPENRFGWLANFYGFVMMWAFLIGGYGECGLDRRAALGGVDYALWLGRALEVPTFMSLMLVPWLFPDGRFLTARWRRVGVAAICLALTLAVLQLFWPGLVRVDSLGRNWIENPVSIDVSGPPWLDAIIAGSGDYLIMFLFLAGIVSLLLRWRRSAGDTRQQIKWLAFFFAISGTMFIAVETLGAIFFPAVFEGWFYLAVLLVFWLGLPMVMGLAVFKYRLYDIDIVIRRTLVYAILTALLALVYFGTVVFLQQVFGRLTGVEHSPLAIVVSTLVIAALFTPLRRRVQDWIDRRFFRQKYDAQQVLAQFALTARDETDLDALTAELVRVVQETMQPEHVSVWLRPAGDVRSEAQGTVAVEG